MPKVADKVEEGGNSSSSRSIRHASRRLPTGFFVALILAILLGGSAMLLFRPSSVQQSPAELRVDDSIRLDFGISREAITRSVRVDICGLRSTPEPTECQADAESDAARPSITSASLVADLVNAETSTQFPVTQISVTASNVSKTGIAISVNANPLEPDDVEPGTYTGNLIVDRADTSITLPITVTLKARAGTPARLAVLALLLGSFGGTLLKWLDDSFSTVAALRRRQRRLEQFLEGERENLPTGVERRLNVIRNAIRNFESDVGATLDEIVKNQDALLTYARTTKSIERYVQAQRKILAFHTGPIPPWPAGIEYVIDLQQAFVSELRDRLWPWEKADDVAFRLREKDGEARRLTSLMGQFAKTGGTPQSDALQKIVDKIMTDDQVAAFGVAGLLGSTERSAAIVQDSSSARSLDAAHDEATPQSFRERRTTAEWLLDNAWWITLAMIALVVVFFGYQTQFLENAAFEGDTLDYYRLAGWALAFQLAGGTLLETLGKLRVSRMAA